MTGEARREIPKGHARVIWQSEELPTCCGTGAKAMGELFPPRAFSAHAAAGRVKGTSGDEASLWHRPGRAFILHRGRFSACINAKPPILPGTVGFPETQPVPYRRTFSNPRADRSQSRREDCLFRPMWVRQLRLYSCTLIGS